MNSNLIPTTTRLEIKLPSGLPQLLEVLGRETIRKQPENIYVFLADLVEELLEKRDGQKSSSSKASEKSDSVPVDAEAEAAVKIQASYRGYKTRKHLKKVKEEKIKDEEIAAELGSPLGTIRENIEEEAAIKIQSGVRGFLTRQRLKKSSSKQTSLSESNEEVDLISNKSVKDFDIEKSDEKSENVLEHELAVERILKEYGDAPVLSSNRASPPQSISDDEITSADDKIELVEKELEEQLSQLSAEKNEFADLTSISVTSSEPESIPVCIPDVFDQKLEEVTLAEVTKELKNEVIIEKEQSEDASKDNDDDNLNESVKSTEALSKDEILSDLAATTNVQLVEKGTEDPSSKTEDNSLQVDFLKSEENLTNDSVQIIDDVLAEAQLIVQSLADKVSEEVEVDNANTSANISKEDTQSDSGMSHTNDVISVEINTLTETEGEPKKVSIDATIPLVKKDVPLEPVPLRNREQIDNKQPAEEVVVRRSKRNTSNTQSKYRSGFVEVEPEHNKMKPSQDLNLPHIEEADLDAEIETEVLNNAATKIQAGFRGYKARSSLNKAKASATRIQASFRGYKARRKIEEEKKAVVTIQATVRGFLARRRLASAKLANQSKRRKSSLGGKLQRRRSSTLNAAAVRIQSAYRGYTVRKNCKEIRQKSSSPTDLRIEDVANNASQIDN